jgi:hypothetical protein
MLFRESEMPVAAAADMLECYYWKVEKGKREHNMFSLWLVSALL